MYTCPLMFSFFAFTPFRSTAFFISNYSVIYTTRHSMTSRSIDFSFVLFQEFPCSQEILLACTVNWVVPLVCTLVYCSLALIIFNWNLICHIWLSSTASWIRLALCQLYFFYFMFFSPRVSETVVPFRSNNSWPGISICHWKIATFSEPVLLKKFTYILLWASSSWLGVEPIPLQWLPRQRILVSTASLSGKRSIYKKSYLEY